jgi:hypothetical protein
LALCFVEIGLRIPSTEKIILEREKLIYLSNKFDIVKVLVSEI